jgi:hypothetical protein
LNGSLAVAVTLPFPDTIGHAARVGDVRLAPGSTALAANRYPSTPEAVKFARLLLRGASSRAAARRRADACGRLRKPGKGRTKRLAVLSGADRAHVRDYCFKRGADCWSRATRAASKQIPAGDRGGDLVSARTGSREG